MKRHLKPPYIQFVWDHFQQSVSAWHEKLQEPLWVYNWRGRTYYLPTYGLILWIRVDLVFYSKMTSVAIMWIYNRKYLGYKMQHGCSYFTTQCINLAAHRKTTLPTCSSNALDHYAVTSPSGVWASLSYWHSLRTERPPPRPPLIKTGVRNRMGFPLQK